jgi:hypothetical protein
VLFVVATSKQNCSGFSALVKQSKTDGGQRDEACKDPKREEEGKEGLAGGTRMEEGVRGMDYKKKQVVGNVTATNGIRTAASGNSVTAQQGMLKAAVSGSRSGARVKFYG